MQPAAAASCRSCGSHLTIRMLASRAASALYAPECYPRAWRSQPRNPTSMPPAPLPRHRCRDRTAQAVAGRLARSHRGAPKGPHRQRVGEGRALAFADDPGWADRVVRLTDDRAPDGELPDDVAAGVVELLARWARQWPARPTTVVAIPSRTHPLLISSLARHIAQVGRLDLVDGLELRGPRPVVRGRVGAARRGRDRESGARARPCSRLLVGWPDPARRRCLQFRLDYDRRGVPAR